MKRIHISKLTNEEYHNLTILVKNGIEHARVITRASSLDPWVFGLTLESRATAISKSTVCKTVGAIDYGSVATKLCQRAKGDHEWALALLCQIRTHLQ